MVRLMQKGRLKSPQKSRILESQGSLVIWTLFFVVAKTEILVILASQPSPNQGGHAEKFHLGPCLRQRDRAAFGFSGTHIPTGSQAKFSNGGAFPKSKNLPTSFKRSGEGAAPKAQHRRDIQRPLCACSARSRARTFLLPTTNPVPRHPAAPPLRAPPPPPPTTNALEHRIPVQFDERRSPCNCGILLLMHPQRRSRVLWWNQR